MRQTLREDIAGAIANIYVVNQHDHSWPSFLTENRPELDLPHFLCNIYLGGDWVAAGRGRHMGAMDARGRPQLPNDTEEAWKVMRPCLLMARNTSYFRRMLKSLREFVGITEMDIFSE